MEFCNLKVLKYSIFVDNIFKETADFETGMAGKAELGPGKQTVKTWFGLENQKENQQNDQRLLLLTALSKIQREKIYFGRA